MSRTQSGSAVYGLWCLVLLGLAVTCAQTWTRDVVQPKGFVLASNHFGLNLFQQLSEQNTQRANLFYSPYSVAIALAMLHQGSGGNTAKQLASTLGYQLAKLDSQDNSVSSQVQNSTQAIFSTEDSNSTYILRSGNALIVGQQFSPLDSYKESLKSFSADLFPVDFSGSPVSATDLINEWCSNKTNGKIKALLAEPPSASTMLALVNAIYFKGTWKLKFNPNQTEEGTFYGPNGENFEKVLFMKAKDYYNVGYLGEIDSDLIELQYESDDLSFFAILPKDKNSDLQLIKKALNPWYLEAAISRSYSQEVELRLPKLNFNTNYDLVSALEALGIKDVFGLEANLTALSVQPNLAVGEVKHAASIEVTEEGSEAAAATYIGIVRLSLQLNTPTYHFNHPFLFFIRHNKNGQILFIGEANRF